MKRVVTILVFAGLPFPGLSQKNFDIGASGNISFATKGLGPNEIGLGVAAYANIFAKNKLRIRIEAGLDQFIGNKLLEIDSLGNKNSGTPALIGARLGPEFFIAENISVAALYGFVRYNYFGDEIGTGNFRMLLNTYLGERKKTFIGLYHSRSDFKKGVQFWGVSLGFKFF
jgi:hypothetical protein